jgi:hypothetical protein
MIQQNFTVTLRVDSTDTGVWDTMSGGKLAASVTKHREGGMGPSVAYAGNANTDDVTLVRTFKRGRDTELWPFIKGRCGKGRCVISKQPLDEDGNAFGRPHVFTGLLSEVEGPEVDSDSEDRAIITLTIVTDGTIG